MNFSQTVHMNSIRTSQGTHYISAAKISRLMKFMEIITLYCENHSKHSNTLCMKNAEFLYVRSKLWVLKVSYQHETSPQRIWCVVIMISFFPNWSNGKKSCLTASVKIMRARAQVNFHPKSHKLCYWRFYHIIGFKRQSYNDTIKCI